MKIGGLGKTWVGEQRKLYSDEQKAMRLLRKDVDGHTQRFMPKKDEKKAAGIFIVYTVKVFKQGLGKENNDRRKDEQDIKYKKRRKEAKPDSKNNTEPAIPHIPSKTILGPAAETPFQHHPNVSSPPNTRRAVPVLSWISQTLPNRNPFPTLRSNSAIKKIRQISHRLRQDVVLNRQITRYAGTRKIRSNDILGLLDLTGVRIQIVLGV